MSCIFYPPIKPPQIHFCTLPNFTSRLTSACRSLPCFPCLPGPEYAPNFSSLFNNLAPSTQRDFPQLQGVPQLPDTPHSFGVTPPSRFATPSADSTLFSDFSDFVDALSSLKGHGVPRLSFGINLPFCPRSTKQHPERFHNSFYRLQGGSFIHLVSQPRLALS